MGVTSSEGCGIDFGGAFRDRPNRCAIRALPQGGSEPAVGRRYFAQRNAPICMAQSEGSDIGSGGAFRDRPNRCAIRAFPQGGVAPASGDTMTSSEVSGIRFGGLPLLPGSP